MAISAVRQDVAAILTCARDSVASVTVDAATYDFAANELVRYPRGDGLHVLRIEPENGARAADRATVPSPVAAPPVQITATVRLLADQAGVATVLQIDNGTDTDRLRLFVSGGDLVAGVTVDGASIAMVVGAVSVGVDHEIAVQYLADGRVLASLDGGAAREFDLIDMPAGLNTLRIGATAAGVDVAGGFEFGPIAVSPDPVAFADAVAGLVFVEEFTPASLFANGEKGAWYDPSDMATLFKDTGAAAPITDVEQIAARIDDKSGNVQSATQATLSARPTLSARLNLKTNSDLTGSVNGVLGSGGSLPTGWSQFTPVGEVVGSGVEAGLGYFDLRLTGSGDKTFLNLLVSSSINADFPAVVSVSSYIVESTGITSASLKLDGSFGGGIQADTVLTDVKKRFSRIKEASGFGQYRWVVSVVAPASWSMTIRLLAVQQEIGTSVSRYQRATTLTDYDAVGFPQYLASDADSMTATMPDLGADATLAYATDAGTALLTGQTIGAGGVEVLRGARTYGFVVVDRALTESEAIDLTAYLDAKRRAE